MLKIGVTASRDGLTENQTKFMESICESIYIESLHHGDCLGGDKDCYDIAHRYDIATVCHPPIISKLRAFTKDNSFVYPEKDYLTRNRDIVNTTDLLVGFPKTRIRRTGGTWYTINYAINTTKAPVVYVAGDSQLIVVKHLTEHIRNILLPALSAYVRKIPA